MLPFLKNRNDEGSVSAPVTAHISERHDEPEYDALEAAAIDLLSAIQRKDVKTICVVLRAAFEIMDAQPHVEGPHV